jgi:hypothetical protein
MRKMMKNSLLGMTLVAGLLGTGAMAANAAPEFHGRVEARGFDRGNERFGGREFERRDYERRDFVRRDFVRPVGPAYRNTYVETYIPPCPGDGYFWTAGYYNDGYWVPGAWTFRGRVGFERDYGRGYRENHFVAERRFDRHDDRRDGRDFRGRR